MSGDLACDAYFYACGVRRCVYHCGASPDMVVLDVSRDGVKWHVLCDGCYMNEERGRAARSLVVRTGLDYPDFKAALAVWEVLGS